MASYDQFLPSQGLGVAAAIGQGAQSFMQAYQGAQQRQQDYAMKQQQFQAENELRQLQMQKIRQELEPTIMDIGKVSIVSKMVNEGNADPSLLKQFQTKGLDNIQTPAQLAYVSQMIEKQSQAKSRYGSDSGMANLMSMDAPQQLPSLMAQGGPQLSGTQVTMNKAEQSLLDKKLGLDAMIQGRMMTADTAMRGQDVSLTRAQMEERARQDRLRQQLESQDKLKRMDNASAERRTKIMAASRGGSAKDLEIQSVIKQIDEINQAKIKVNMPSQGIDLTSRRDKEAKAQGLEQQAQQAYDRYKALTGRDYGSQRKVPASPMQPTGPGARSSAPAFIAAPDKVPSAAAAGVAPPAQSPQALPYDQRQSAPVGALIQVPPGVSQKMMQGGVIKKTGPGTYLPVN